MCDGNTRHFCGGDLLVMQHGLPMNVPVMLVPPRCVNVMYHFVSARWRQPLALSE